MLQLSEEQQSKIDGLSIFLQLTESDTIKTIIDKGIETIEREMDIPRMIEPNDMIPVIEGISNGLEKGIDLINN